MESEERGLSKLELDFILEDFSKNAYLENTKARFLSLPYIADKAEYEKRRRASERYFLKIYPNVRLSEYKIEKADKAAEEIFKVNGELEKKYVKCVSDALLCVCRINRTDREFFQEELETKIETSEIEVLAKKLSSIISDEGEILSSASPELHRIRKEKDSLLSSQQKIIDKTIKNYESMLMEDSVTLLDNRIVLQVDMHRKNMVKGVLHAYSNSKKTAFIEPEELVIFNNRITELEQDEEVEIARIMESFRQMLISTPAVKISLTKLINEIDFINAIAVYMDMKGARFASLGEKINLKRAYHPIIKKMKLDKAVPVDLNLEKGNSMMITGPNMGGKTALLKTIGVFSLTIKLALPVLADEGTVLPLFDRVLADIGDDQSIEEGVSTFASHVINYRRFLNDAKENTLVLLDEIGTGTSIKEGSAFAITLIKELIDKKAVCVFTSHFDSIKEFALSRGDIKAASMKYDYSNNTPYFQIVMDSVGDSGVFSILKKYDFPDELISSAKSLIGTDYVNYSDLIEKYKRRIGEIEEKSKSLDMREKAITKIESIIAKEKKQTEERLENLSREHKEATSEEIATLRRNFELIVKEIRESSASKESIKKAKEFLESEKKNFDAKTKTQHKKQEMKTDGVYKEGDYVVLTSGIEGYIEKISGESFVLSVNGVTLNTRTSNIAGHKDKDFKSELKVSFSEEISGNELDLRGMYAEDAIEALEKFLMRSSRAGLHEVVIIHGHGTGVLKREVRNYLKKQKDIKSFDSGREMSGGDGVTVVKLP
ncbi:MAG: Smr/MutS family protein [bacterium]|nr:Smr/MutS family protein [bacterium]